ncbi:hypothetical protein bcgnr5371_42790 [Bacillus cereus]
MNQCEVILIQTLRGLGFHPSHALSALNKAFYEAEGASYAVQTLADAIEQMEEIEEELEEEL